MTDNNDSDKEPDMLQTELEAFRGMGELLQPLPADIRERVLDWANKKFMPEDTSARMPSVMPRGGTITAVSTGAPNELPGTLGELFAAADPQTEGEKALVAAFWIQERTNQGADFTAFDANKALRDLGYGVANITSALDNLIEVRPQLVIQLAKAGTSKQARKRYKVTGAGVKKVQELLSRAASV